MGTGKLPVRVVVNKGRWPLNPKKRVGYRVERRCHYHIWEIVVSLCERGISQEARDERRRAVSLGL